MTGHDWTFIAIVGAVAAIFGLAIFYGGTHMDSDRAACEQRGGVFLQRDRVCIKKEATL